MSNIATLIRKTTHDGRARVLYVLAIAITVFVLGPMVVAVAGLLQLVLWWRAGLGAFRLVRLVRKLLPFFVLLAVTSVFVSGFGPDEQWVQVPFIPFDLNLTGLEAAGLMILRLLVVVMASHIARSGDPAVLVLGLRRLGVPERVALALDTTLFLLSDVRGGGGRGRGTGGGGGGGRKDRRDKTDEVEKEDVDTEDRNPYRSLGALLRGNVTPLIDGVAATLRRAESHVRSQAGDRDPAIVRDVAVIAGVSLAMLSLKMLKILPGLPVAPGHKGILLIPLYILAGVLTRNRWGATMTGLTMGSVAFLMGDGKYGIFEILKHLTPGLIVDAGLPLVYRAGRSTSALVWSVFGLVIASGRFASIVCVILLLQVPLATLAVLAPVGAVHLTFGALSGFVTFHLVRAGSLIGSGSELRRGVTDSDPIPMEVTHGRNP